MLAPIFFDIANYIPVNIPYLKPPKEINSHMKHYVELETIPSIGVVWKGNSLHTHDKERSIHPSIIKQIKTSKLLVSLQHNEYEEGLLNVGVLLQDWSDTAHAIAKMDLIITVDTAVAHLAGAMGKETWILLQKHPDWRWGLEKPSTPWYPSVRLFRKDSSWEQLIDKINQNLSI
jgi:hypothetical protein